MGGVVTLQAAGTGRTGAVLATAIGVRMVMGMVILAGYAWGFIGERKQGLTLGTAESPAGIFLQKENNEGEDQA